MKVMVFVLSWFRRHGKLRVRYSRLLGSESGVVQFRSFATNNSSGDSEQLLGNKTKGSYHSTYK